MKSNKFNSLLSESSLKTERIFRFAKKAAAAAFWLVLWEIIYLVVDKEILIASPLDTLIRIGQLCTKASFWQTALYSLVRITLGFVIGLLAGVVLAAASKALPFLYTLLRPIVVMSKATPVASFIILALVWITAARVPTFISALMVFPVVYNNIYEGLHRVDSGLLEMADVFNVRRKSRFLHITLPAVYPYFISAVTTGIGLAWKAGIAAEVLSTPRNSIGLQLHNSKIYIETKDLFAWTAVVIILSLILEYLFVLLIKKASVNIKIRPGEAPEKRQGATLPITFTGISKHFGEKAVLDNVSFTLPLKGVVAVMGASGYGKTTLMNILAGTLTPDGGKSLPAVYPSVMFQDDRMLAQATVAENIRFVNPAADVSELLEAVELTGCEAQLPQELSGGMRRRVALARTLGYESGVYFLDEPFKGLDSELKDRVARRVFDRLRDKTVVFVTHDRAEAERYADTVFELDKNGADE